MTLFSYSHVKLAPQEYIGLHEHSSWQLTYTVIGSGIRLIGEETSPFESGEMVLIPPQIPHCWYFDKTQTDDKGNIANICVSFDSNLLHIIGHNFPALSERMQKLEGDSCSRIFTRKQANAIAQVMKKMDKESEAERTASMVRLLVLITDEQGIGQRVAHKKEDATQSRINQIANYMICNSQRDIRLNHLAQHIGMSRSSLCLFLKTVMGVTFTEYLNNIRIEQACELLRKKGTPIKEVGYAVGYNSTSYFIRAFTKLKGCSPKEYRAAQHLPDQ